MVPVSWDYKKFLQFQLLPRNLTINLNVYVQQLSKLRNAIQEEKQALANHEAVVFQLDNAKPHTSLGSRQKLLELG